MNQQMTNEHFGITHLIFANLGGGVVLCNCFMDGEICPLSLSLSHTHLHALTHAVLSYSSFLLSECTLYCSISLTDVLISPQLSTVRLNSIKVATNGRKDSMECAKNVVG